MNVRSLLNSDEEDHSRRPWRKCSSQPSKTTRRSSQNKFGPSTTSHRRNAASSEDSVPRPPKTPTNLPAIRIGSNRINKRSSLSRVNKANKRQKAGKQVQKRDIFAWILRKPVLAVRYYPQDTGDPSVRNEMLKFRLERQKDLTEYAVNIPYNGTKKDLISKIGRESLEVFHYKYAYSGGAGNNEKWDVAWDYNNGLVRMTPFFKSLGYNKTVPSKVIDANPGLRDVSHNVTGGNIGAQGYWVPYKAAKALTARFCWSIKYALVPLFGDDFIDLCVCPGHKDFENWKIPAWILSSCAAQLSVYKNTSSSPEKDSEPRTITKLKYGHAHEFKSLFPRELSSTPCQNHDLVANPMVTSRSDTKRRVESSDTPLHEEEINFHRTRPIVFPGSAPLMRIQPKPCTEKITAEDARTALTMLQIRYFSSIDSSALQEVKDRSWQ